MQEHPDIVKRRSQIVKVLEKRKGNLFADLSLEKFSLPQDTWDSLLIPEEPDPSFYDNYEEYESAMLKWTNLIININAKRVPCHATQLSTLIPIHIPQAEQINEKSNVQIQQQQQEMDEGQQMFKSSIVFRSFLPVNLPFLSFFFLLILVIENEY